MSQEPQADPLPLLLDLDGAEFDGRYRYRLWRTWDEGADRLTWVILNPSTANAVKPDPTMTKCIGFARRWGFGSIEIVNLYAFRTPKPRLLRAAIAEHGEPYAVGPRNDQYILDACARAKTVVAAWGAQKGAEGRASVVKTLLRESPSIVCLGFTQARQPLHPLYIPYDTAPEPFA